MSDQIPDYYKKIRKPLAPPTKVHKSKKDRNKYKEKYEDYE